MTSSRLRGLASLLAMPICFVGVDLFVDKHAAPLQWSRAQWGIWSTGFVWDLSAWIGFVVLLSWIGSISGKWPRRAFWSMILIDSAALSFATALSAGYREVFHHLPNVHALEFAIVEWRNALTMIEDGFTPWAIVWFAVSIPCFAGMHLLGARAWTDLTRNVKGWRRRLVALSPLVVLLTASPFALGWHRFQEPLPLFANWSRIFFQYGLMLTGNRTNLQAPNRIEIGSVATPPWNILLILNESLRSDAFQPEQDLIEALDHRALAPKLSAFLDDPMVTYFPRARSNSTATSVSVPSLLTGVATHGSTFQFHRAPTIFQAGKAAGMRTFLLTSQDWRWEHFDQFFFGSIDHVVHRTSWDRPRVNDLGVDDALTLDSLGMLLTTSPTPFLGVWQFNANHGPYYPGPHRDDLPLSSMPRYKESIRYVDSLLGEGLEILKSRGFLEKTIVIVVADHGENVGARQMGRINSFYEECVRVPFIIRTPEQFANSKRGQDFLQRLSQWRRFDVQLLDIAPTIYDLLGFLDRSEVGSFCHGTSLLAPPDTNRILSGQNTGDIRSWDIEGGYLLRNGVKLVFSNGAKGGLFDLKSDPHESRDLWDSESFRDAQITWLRQAFQTPGIAAICQRAGNSCPRLPTH